MSEGVQILGPNGQPLPTRANKMSMLAGGWDVTPYDAADIYSDKMAGWRPSLWSPDSELNIYRDRIVSRVRDLVRNDGWASGAVTRLVDNVVGANFRPISKPNFRLLALRTGNKKFDHVWADEYGRAVDAYFAEWADDPGFYCDVHRKQTFGQMMRLGFRHNAIDGDAIAISHWLPNRQGPGRARYATAIQLIDPDRLSNPQQQFDNKWMRGGVVIDEFGSPTGYWIRRAHLGDWFNAEKAWQWDKIDRETSWGRAVTIHYYDHDRANQHRGGAGVFTPVVQRLRMLIKYDTSELDAAILNAVFGAYVESPFDPQMVEMAMSDGEHLPRYQEERSNFHKERKTALGEMRMPILFPGEKINAVTAARPSGNFEAFESAVLRNFASATGMSEQQVSQNWSNVNYSSARGALLEAWKTFDRRRFDYGVGFGQPIYTNVVEEIYDTAKLPMPQGERPDFIEYRGALSRARWVGPGRGWIDPVKEPQGSVLKMDAALSNLDEETDSIEGGDWREKVEQRALEVARFRELGLPLPNWAAGAPANEAMKEEQPE